MTKEAWILPLLGVIALMTGYNTFLIRGHLGAHEQAPVAPANTASAEANAVNPYAKADLRSEVFTNAQGTFGYRILHNGAPLVEQPNIPGLPGNAGFTSPEKAAKAGELVIGKIRENIMPPTVSLAELDSLHLLDTP